MKILFLQFSDLHIAKIDNVYDANIGKIIDALNVFSDIDEYVIIISGDISSSGKHDEFVIAGTMIETIADKLKKKGNKDKQVNTLVVPGNHDLDMAKTNRSFEDIVDSMKKNNEIVLVKSDIDALADFYKFSRYYNCFDDNNMISQRLIDIGGFKINFTLINTAIFSLLGSDNQDKGIHYLDDESFNNLISHQKSDLNVAIMHHGIEWFADGVKDRLRDLLCDKFSLVFEGHEHDGHTESRKINNLNPNLFLQGNTLSGDKKHPKGFVATKYNSTDKTIESFSFTWMNDFYKSKVILKETLIEKQLQKFKVTEEFLHKISFDDNNKKLSQFFVFPSLNNTITNANDEIVTNTINDIDLFAKIIRSNDRTIISGESKSGKTSLAKIICKYFIDQQNDIVPILLFSEDIRNRRIEKVIEDAFDEQYQEKDEMYSKFLQLEKEKRLVILDDAEKLTSIVLDKLLELFDELFINIILLSEEKLDLNIGKRVVERLIDKKVARISIRPFLYDKRKELISKICPPNMDDNIEVINNLNDMISLQARYFQLDPEFIISFVSQYFSDYKFDFSSESNIFSIVYENSIKDRIIKNISPDKADALFRSFCEVAFFKQFEKKTWITIGEASSVIDKYNKEFRQNVDFMDFIKVGEKSKIIIIKDSQIRFKSSNLLAYFVAKALNIKYYHKEENISEKIEYLLSNLCFSINSDIILFLSFITNNPEIINVVVNCAENHFANMEELNFDKNNIPFLCQSDFCVKSTVPDNTEKKERENRLIKYEEEVKTAELVELIDEYDYDEDDINIFENQVIKSLKYLEILSKILPAFSLNMKVNQQDALVESIYRFPNCFLYFWLNKLSDNYEELVSELYTEINELRREKNISEMHITSIQKMIEQISISLIVNLYQLVANTATTVKTINALNIFDFSSNSNYFLMNLMMVEKTGKVAEFYIKADNLYDNTEIKLVKSMVKYTVRNFFLHHNVKFVGATQSAMDKYFGKDETSNFDKKYIRTEMAKNRSKKKNTKFFSN